MPQTLVELGGNADHPILHLAPANGFVPQTYLPLLRPLTAQYRVVSLPPRALWGDQIPPALSNAPLWHHVADDMLAGFDQYGFSQVVAVGHSMGGVASMIALLKHPERFRALVLLDPTFLDESIVEMLASAFQAGFSDQHPLAQAALNRKRQFDTPQAFYDRYRHHPLFANWDEEAFALYVEHGTQANAHGTTLTWSPEWESFYFSTGYPETWRTIPKMNALSVPILIVQGATSDTFTTANAQRVREMVPSATHVSIPDHGHLFPQSAPHATTEIIHQWLKDTLK